MVADTMWKEPQSHNTGKTNKRSQMQHKIATGENVSKKYMTLIFELQNSRPGIVDLWKKILPIHVCCSSCPMLLECLVTGNCTAACPMKVSCDNQTCLSALFRHFLGITFQLFQLLCLAKDH